MKKLAVFVFVFIFCVNLLPCYAMNTGAEITPLSSNESSQVISSLDFQYHAQDPKIQRRFRAFDVNERGEFALLFDNEWSREYLVIYDENGSFQFAFSWTNQLSTVEFEWDGENLIVYRAGNYAILFDRQGNPLEVCEYFYPVGYLDALQSTKKRIGKTTYTTEYPLDFIIKEPFDFIGAYTRLVKTTATNEKVVLYESSMLPSIIIFILIVIIIAVVLINIFSYRKHRKEYYENAKQVYYENKNNYVSASGIITHMKYSSDGDALYFGFSDMSFPFGDTSFKIVGENLCIAKKNNIDEKIEIGNQVEFVSAPRYFGDGYVMPIIALSVKEDYILSFDEGYNNFISQRLFKNDK